MCTEKRIVAGAGKVSVCVVNLVYGHVPDSSKGDDDVVLSKSGPKFMEGASIHIKYSF